MPDTTPTPAGDLSPARTTPVARPARDTDALIAGETAKEHERSTAFSEALAGRGASAREAANANAQSAILSLEGLARSLERKQPDSGRLARRAAHVQQVICECFPPSDEQPPLDPEVRGDLCDALRAVAVAGATIADELPPVAATEVDSVAKLAGTVYVRLNGREPDAPVGGASASATSRLDLLGLQVDAAEAVESLFAAKQFVQSGRDWQPLLDRARAKSDRVFATVEAFVGNEAELDPAQRDDLECFAGLIGFSVAQSTESIQALEDALVDDTMRRGGAELTMQELKALNDQQATARLIDVADALERPVCMRYFGRTIVVEPGNESDRGERADRALAAVDARRMPPNTGLVRAMGEAKRRIALSDAQCGPARSLDELLEAGRQLASERHAGEPTPLTAAACLLQTLTSRKEIRVVARHLLELAVSVVSRGDAPDRGARVDSARYRAGQWLALYGTNDRTIDAVWEAALEVQAALMKA